MKKTVILVGVLFGIALPSLATASVEAQTDTSLTTASQNAVEVSIINLIATPEKYEGKLIRIIGFVVLQFEGNGIYLHREDYQLGDSKNAIWLDVEGKPNPAFAAGHWGIVEGVFTVKRKGHEDAYSGEISQINRLELWPHTLK